LYYFYRLLYDFLITPKRLIHNNNTAIASRNEELARKYSPRSRNEYVLKHVAFNANDYHKSDCDPYDDLNNNKIIAQRIS